MGDIKYKLRYLPLFYRELEQKVLYIAEHLHNEKAANDLLDAVEKAILEIRRFLYNKQDWKNNI